MSRQWLFGDYRIDPAARELHHAEASVMLPPKVFDCLVYLAEHRERAVGRDELIAAVWGRTEISDALLGQTLLRARRAVGDSGETQNVIRTLPRFGYRWVAALQEIEMPSALVDPPAADDTGVVAEDDAAEDIPAAAVDESVHSDAPADASSPSDTLGMPVASSGADARPAGRRRLWPHLGLLAVAAVALLLVLRPWTGEQRNAPAVQSAAPTDADAVVLVLPVELVDARPSDAWLRLGAMDYMATQLRSRAQLRVVPSEQALRLANDAPPDGGDAAMSRIAAAVGAGHVLAPQARRIGARWQVSLLDHADPGAAMLQAEADEPLQAADNVLNAWLSGRGAAPLAAPDDRDVRLQRIDAELLSGRLAEAAKLLDGAPSAWQQKPEYRLRAGLLAHRSGQIEEADTIFSAILQQADVLDPATRSQAHIGKGRLAMRTARFVDAEQAFTAAIDALQGVAEPGLKGTAHNGRGVALGAQGRLGEAQADFGTARSWYERAGDRLGAARIDSNLGQVEARNGRPAEAARAFARSAAVLEQYGERDDLFTVLGNLARAQLADIQPAAAYETGRRGWESGHATQNPEVLLRLGEAYATALIATGRLGQARELLDHLAERSAGQQQLSPKARGEAALAETLYALETGAVDRARDAVAGLKLHLQHALQVGEDELARRLSEALCRIAIATADAAALDALIAQIEAEPRPGQSASLALLRAQRAALRDSDDVDTVFERALADTDSSGRRPEFVYAASSYVMNLLARGRTEDAAGVAGRLAPEAQRSYEAAWVRQQLYRALGRPQPLQAATEQLLELAGERDIERMPPGLIAPTGDR